MIITVSHLCYHHSGSLSNKSQCHKVGVYRKQKVYRRVKISSRIIFMKVHAVPQSCMSCACHTCKTMDKNLILVIVFKHTQICQMMFQFFDESCMGYKFHALWKCSVVFTIWTQISLVMFPQPVKLKKIHTTRVIYTVTHLGMHTYKWMMGYDI